MSPGRPTAPTPEEINAHHQSGGTGWLIRYRNENGHLFMCVVRLSHTNGVMSWSTQGGPYKAGWSYGDMKMRYGTPAAEWWWPLNENGISSWPGAGDAR